MKKKVSKRVHKKLPKSYHNHHQDLQELTKTEEIVLTLLQIDKLKPKEIAIARQTSRRTVYNILQRIKKKGWIDGKYSEGSQNRPPVTKEVHKKLPQMWRYHALHFVIKPYYFYPRYQKMIKEIGNSSISYRDWKIKLRPKSLEMQLRPLRDFADVDLYEATRQAEKSFERTLREISNSYGFEVFKNKKINIKLVNHHLAKTNSPLARAKKGEYLKVKGADGKIWFTIDKSKGVFEHEFQHPYLAVDDAEILEPFLNDLRKYPALISDIVLIQHDMGKSQQKLLSDFKIMMESHKAVQNEIKEIATGLKGLMQLIYPRSVKERKGGDGVDEKEVGNITYVG